MIRKTLTLLTAVLILSSTAFAAYTISRTDAGPNTLVQGRDYEYKLSQTGTVVFDNVEIIATGDYQITVGPGIQVGPNEYKVDASGELTFFFRGHVAPVAVSLTATNTNDGTQFTNINLTMQRFPVTFAINPSIPSFDAGVPKTVQVTALDSVGTVVTAFEDNVQITDLFGDVTVIPGSTFSNGVASSSVTVRAGDMQNKTQLTVDLVGIQYMTPSPQPPATFTSPQLNLVPGAFNKIIMLTTNGEILTPGIGKTGTPITQVANVPVDDVTIWPVDSFFNPIRTNVNITVSFTSSNPGDTPPGDRVMIVPPLQILGGGVDPWNFLTAGSRNITATPDGNSSQSDTSVVDVSPGANNLYNFIVQPPAITDTDTVFQIQIEATDGLGTRQTTLFGTLPNSVLSARVIGTPVEEKAAWVDTNCPTLVPDNVVDFSAGVATVNLCVTKRATQVQLHFQDQFGVGQFSNTFEVRTGALDKIHLTILGEPGVLVGETFTQGTYPGNSGTPPVVTAGDQLVVEARLTDRHWNVISGPSINGTQIQLDSIVPDTYIVASHPDDPSVTFDISGELQYQVPPFDKSFRVSVRTAGTDRQFQATTDFTAQTFLSSTMTINADSYSNLVLEVPGEILRPGSFFTEGKEGSPNPQSAGLSFNGTVYVVDQFWNPIGGAGPYPNVEFGINPSNPSSFISGVTLGSPVSMSADNRTFSITLEDDSDVTVTDSGNGSRTQTVSILVGAGLLDHFDLTFNTPGAKEAGVPYNVTIEAKDQFNNVLITYNQTINLEATNGPGTMTPTSIPLTNGTFTGDFTNFASGTGVQIRMSKNSVISLSAPFNINPNAAGFQKLLLLGPGETHAPGTATGKTGNNAAQPIGTGITMRALATDPYYNILVGQSGNTIDFTSDQYAVFSPASGNLATGEFSTTFVMHAAKLHTVTAAENNLGFTSSTTIQGNPGAYSRIQILAPGEILDEGNQATGGKDGVTPPTQQKAGVKFPVTIRAVDNFYNLTSFTGGNSEILVNTINNVVIPANSVSVPFANGVAQRDVLIGEENLITGWQLTARDQDDLTKQDQSVNVFVQPGPTYEFILPSSATVGSNFNATIRFQEGGVPVNGYNETIFLDAFLPGGGPATGNFLPNGNPHTTQMTDGVANVSLSYAHVENIQIRITDNLSGIAFSNTINMIPSGLKYRVTAPASATAGPPSVFSLTVELLEQTTETLVKNSNYNHTIDLQVNSLLNPPAAGTLSQSNAPINQGVASLNLSYSKAEEINIQILENGGALGVTDGFSNSITINSDGYKKLLIVAPGETHTPGLLGHPTGKAGTPLPVDKGTPQTYQVRGVDQHWNIVNSFTGGSISFEANDGSTNQPGNPVNQGAQLINGQTAASIFLNTAGTIALTVRDTNNVSIIPQSVDIVVEGTFFEFVTIPTSQNSCSAFSLGIALKDTGNSTVNYTGPITIEALKPDLSPADGQLDVTSANMSAGNVTIPNQRYTIAEDVRLRISGNDTVSISPVIGFVPREVFYVYTTFPTEGEVNVAFPIVIQTMDTDCGTEVKNFNTSNLPLNAFSAATSLPVSGNFLPATMNIVNGKGIVNASYDQAESIFVVLTDAALPSPNYPSPNTINIKPGALANVSVSNFTMQSNETREMTVTAFDSFANIIPGQTLKFQVAQIPSGQMMINGNPNSYSGKTNDQGQLTTDWDPTTETNGRLTIIVSDGDRPNGYSKTFTIDVKGFPETVARALALGGDRVPVNTPYCLDLDQIDTQLLASGGIRRTFYRLNGGSWTSYQTNSCITGLSQTGTYHIEWFSEICYDPSCTNPVSELSINGAPNFRAVTTFVVENKLTGYPSPFNPKSAVGTNFLTIQFPLQTTSTVDVEIYDLFGQKVYQVSQVVNPEAGSGGASFGRIFWNGANNDGHVVSNGGYVVRINVGATGNSMNTKVLVVK